MKKVSFLVSLIVFTVFANAAEVVVNPKGWKSGDSRNYKCVTVNNKGEILNHELVMRVNSVEADKYLVDYKHVTDTTSNSYLGIKKMFGDKLAESMNEFVYKISLSKQGEFGNFENYQELKGLFGGGVVEAMLQALVGTSQEDAEKMYLSEIKSIFCYMNKKFDDKKDNLVKRDFIEKVSVYEDVEANVKAEVSKGKQIFTLEANLSEEEFISETEKAFRDTINSLAKSMGVQPSMFEDKVKERMDELKNLKLSAVIKEKVVFDEKTGWLISYDRVMELHSAVTGETFIESRCTISGK
jgi:hypothetical protein